MSSAEKSDLIPAMKIKIKAAMQALDMTRPHELATFVGASRPTGYYWEDQELEHLPELWCYKLLEKRPELRRLVQDDAA